MTLKGFSLSVREIEVFFLVDVMTRGTFSIVTEDESTMK